MQELPNRFYFSFFKKQIRERRAYAFPEAKRCRYRVASSPAQLLMPQGQKAKETKARKMIYHFTQQIFILSYQVFSVL